jgi:hypothetical protein
VFVVFLCDAGAGFVLVVLGMPMHCLFGNSSPTKGAPKEEMFPCLGNLCVGRITWRLKLLLFGCY